MSKKRAREPQLEGESDSGCTGGRGEWPVPALCCNPPGLVPIPALSHQNPHFLPDAGQADFCPRTAVEVEAQEVKPVAQGYITGGSESQRWALFCSQAALLAVRGKTQLSPSWTREGSGPGGIFPPQ